jgi:hypothetical protein
MRTVTETAPDAGASPEAVKMVAASILYPMRCHSADCGTLGQTPSLTQSDTPNIAADHMMLDSRLR